MLEVTLVVFFLWILATCAVSKSVKLLSGEQEVAEKSILINKSLSIGSVQRLV